MKISTLNSHNKNNIFFSSGLYSAQRKFINNLDTVDIAQKIKKEHGIKCDFAGNKMIAGLCAKTVGILEKLGVEFPQNVSIEKFRHPENEIIAQATLDLITKENQIKFNAEMLSGSLDTLDNYVNQNGMFWGSNHILTPFIHEFLHIHHYYQLSKYEERFSQCFMPIPKKFRPEIKEKIAEYGTSNFKELYATYHAKEISKALNTKWELNYNPLESPKINLSPELRKYINALENPQKLLRLTYENMD